MTHPTERLPIALDAMGGDFAPAAAVEGALDAVRRFKVQVLLVGDETALQRELARLGGSGKLRIVHAAETIGMDEHAATAVRRRRDSSACARRGCSRSVGA